MSERKSVDYATVSYDDEHQIWLDDRSLEIGRAGYVGCLFVPEGFKIEVEDDCIFFKIKGD